MGIPRDKKRDFLKDEMYLGFKEGVKEEEREKLFNREGLEVIRYLAEIRVYRVKLTQDQNVLEEVERIIKDERIEFAEPHYLSEVAVNLNQVQLEGGKPPFLEKKRVIRK